LDIAASSSHEISKLIPGSGDETLQELPNILGSYLAPPSTPKAPVLPKAKIGLSKAAVLTFQTWAARADAAGIVYGKVCKSGGWQGLQMVVANSLDRIWTDSSLALYAKDSGLSPVAIIFQAELQTEDRWASVRETWCKKVVEQSDIDRALFVLATQLVYGHVFSIIFIYFFLIPFMFA